MKIAIIYSLPTRRAKQSHYLETDEDTEHSARLVLSAVESKGAAAFLVPVSEDDAEDKIGKIRADLIIDLIEWTGLDTPLSIAAVTRIEQTGIPFTGANANNFAMTTDKHRMKQVLLEHNLPTARWQEFRIGSEPVRPDFTYPVIVKLTLEHCSIGLSHDAVVSHAQDLSRLVARDIQTFNQPVIAEEFITGREFQVTVLDRPSGLTVLPPAEIFFSNTEGFLTYGGRWDETNPDYKTSSISVGNLTPSLARKINTVALDTFTKLKFFDYARLDIRVRDEDIFILEANANPGLDDDPEYGITVSYKALGMTFADFIWEIVLSALKRFKQYQLA